MSKPIIKTRIYYETWFVLSLHFIILMLMQCLHIRTLRTLLSIYSELWFSSPCSTHLPFLPETVCSCTKKYDIRFCSDFCSMLRSPTDYSGSNRTLLFECSQEIRERLANTMVPGLCTFNKTGMQKSVHTSGSCLKQICLRRGLKEIRSYYIHFKFPLPR